MLGRFGVRRERSLAIDDDVAAASGDVPDTAAGLVARPRGVWMPVTSGLPGRGVVMATPSVRDTQEWEQFCRDHLPSTVVDLGTRAEAASLNHCMRSSAPVNLAGGTIVFVARSARFHGGLPEDLRIAAIGKEAVVRPLRIEVRPHPETRAIGSLLQTREQAMDWLQIPVSRDEAIAPRMLQETCRHLRGTMSTTLSPPGCVAFVSPDGDRRAQVFAAAWRLQQLIDRDDWTEPDAAMLVQKVCLDLDHASGGAAIDRREDIASLLAFATLAMRAQRSGPAGGAEDLNG